MPETLLRFVHITDTHLSADPHYNYDGAMHTPLMGARALVHELNKLPFTPDFVLHTGDVAYNPDETAYYAAREVFGALKCPIYYLPGNHDQPDALQRVLLDRDAAAILRPFDYEFEVNGVQIVCVDSNRPAKDPRGKVSGEQLTWLQGLCRAADNRPLVVAVHHNVLPMGAAWWDDFMSMENGADFHQALLPARARLRGVFFGHVHQNTATYRDGILYASTLSSWYQLHNYPNQAESAVDRYAGAGYSIVTLARDQTFIRRYRYSIDPGSLTGSL